MTSLQTDRTTGKAIIVRIDGLGITVWNRSNQLWFSSNWDGTKTVDQTIAAGDVRVR